MQFQECLENTPFKKLLKYPRNCRLHNTLIPWSLKNPVSPIVHIQVHIYQKLSQSESKFNFPFEFVDHSVKFRILGLFCSCYHICRCVSRNAISYFTQWGQKCFWYRRKIIYCQIASSNTSRLEADAGLFRLVMKGTFSSYILWPFDKKLISLL